jgi:hypothetical protein
MKLIGKNILACAVGAGLLTFASGRAQALVIDDQVATVVNAQLIIKFTTGDGKIKKASITSKDLINAIGEDNDLVVKGDQIVTLDRSSDAPEDQGDFWLMDKHGNLISVQDDDDSLTDDGIIIANYDDLSDSDNEGNNGKFKFVETGVLDFEFYSDGVTPTDVEDDEGSLDDNTLEFASEGPYSYSETGTGVNHNNKEKITVTEKDSISATGHDFDVLDSDDDEIIFGMMTQDGSGTIIDEP